ncbi:uncharacterized protein [Diadema antillarum]|uniref:uncharacterized protein n=1 Tax=Diadema antillarum TaxID=105358 RepID=UPI003A860E2F
MSALRSFFICLAFVLPFLSSAENQTCELSPVPLRCSCAGSNLTCSGYWPSLADLQQANVRQGLEMLTITQNSRSSLSGCEDVFGTLPALRSLDLSDNQIQFAASRSFSSSCFPALERLVLDDNALRLDSNQTFTSLPNLLELSLNQALVLNLTSKLTNTLSLGGLERLEELWLNDNQLSALNINTFHFDESPTLNDSRPSALSRIHLQNNSLAIVVPGTFEATWLPALTFIDLSMNQIPNLVKDTLKNWDEFPELTVNLTGNPLVCNCELEDFLQWLNETKVSIVDVEELTCAPGSFVHEGQELVSFKANELNCTEITNVNSDDQLSDSYILLITVLSIIGFLALVILFMRRKEILRLCTQMKQATKETFDTHHTTYIYSDINRATRDTPEHSAVDV